jgi:GLPGLI family protein
MRIVFLFLFFTSISVFSQTRNFYYQLKYKADSNNIESVKEEVFILNIDKHRSLFTSIKNFKSDSMVAIIKKNYQKYGGSVSFKGVPKSDFTSYIIKPDSINQIIYYDKIGKNNFYYLDDKNMTWTITKDKKQINEINCQKAIMSKFGRDFVAWFSNEIPISNGPYKFQGLPGLIVELYDDKMQYYFKLIKFDPKDNNSMEMPKERLSKLIFTEKNKFNIAQKEYKESLSLRIKNSGLISDENRLKQINENIKKENNPLELKN